MFPNHPYNLSYFSNETTPQFPMQSTLINNYQIQPSESTRSQMSSLCPEPVRKRSNRTDRHSKIRTAQGERDRRMRLSVQVAREFFALQDRLGYDKASQTLDWLLNQAKESIDQIKASSNLPHEVITPNNGTLNYANATIADQIHAIIPEKLKNIAPCNQSVTKESRDKARLRARERAKEKKKKNGMTCKLDQLDQLATVVSPDEGMDGNCGNELEYYYYLTEILSGNFDGCGMEIEYEKGGLMPGMQFN